MLSRPGNAQNAQCGSSLRWRRKVEGVPGYACSKGDYHYAEDYACRKYINSHGGAVEKDTQDRHPPKSRLQGRLYVFGHNRGQGKEAPHPVDYAGYSRKELYRRPYRTLEGARSDLGYEYGYAERHGDGHHQGKERSYGSAEKVGGRSEGLGHWVPVGGEDKFDDAELPYRGSGLFEENEEYS